MVRTNSPPSVPSQQDPQLLDMDSHISTRDSSSDFSVLSQPPESQYSNGTYSGMNDLPYAISATPYSYVVDPSLKQMSELITNLQQENAELKEAVRRDHETMKKQFELMLQSKEQIEVAMKQQQEKREQAKAFIEQLKLENEGLQSQVECLTKELDTFKLGPDAKSNGDEIQEICNHQLQMELEELRKDIDQLKRINSKLINEKKDLAAINAELQAKCSSLPLNVEESCNDDGSLEDNEDNQSFLVVQTDSKHDKMLQSQRGEDNTIKNLLQQLHLEQLKSQELENKLVEERTKCESLTRDIKGQEDVIRRLATSSQDKQVEEHTKLITELENSNKMLDVSQTELKSYKDRCQTLEDQISHLNNQVLSLQVQVQSAKGAYDNELQKQTEILQEERQSNVLYKETLNDTEAKHAALMDDHNQLRCKFEAYSQDQHNKIQQTETYYNLQMKTLQEKLDRLAANLVEAKDSLAVKEQELTKTVEEMEKIKSETEIIPILQTQLEVYRADFAAEREARTNAQSEKESLLTDVRRLRSRVQTLEQTARNSGSPSSRNRRDVRHGSSARDAGATADPNGENKRFECPTCYFMFKDYQALLNHVETCLSRGDPIP